MLLIGAMNVGRQPPPEMEFLDVFVIPRMGQARLISDRA
jgi:hypothetical protein